MIKLKVTRENVQITRNEDCGVLRCTLEKAALVDEADRIDVISAIYANEPIEIEFEHENKRYRGKGYVFNVASVPTKISLQITGNVEMTPIKIKCLDCGETMFIDKLHTCMPSRERQLENCIRRLRNALDLCANPETGWPEVEVADAYEASRGLVPDEH